LSNIEINDNKEVDGTIGLNMKGERKENSLKWSQFILFIITYLGINIGIGFLIGIYGGVTNTDVVNKVFSGYNALLIDFTVFFIAFLIFKSVRRFTFEVFNFVPMASIKTYLYIVASCLIFFLTQYLLIDVFKIEDASQQASDLGVDSLSNWLGYTLFYVAVVVLTPIKEEFLFRGVLHRFLEVRYSFWLGLIVSSVVFGILHFGFPISAGIMGIVFVALYRLTKSIVPSIFLHIVWNLIASFILTLS
jgi:membrane protease YdiL (CAAX protease family)